MRFESNLQKSLQIENLSVLEINLACYSSFIQDTECSLDSSLPYKLRNFI